MIILRYGDEGGWEVEMVVVVVDIGCRVWMSNPHQFVMASFWIYSPARVVLRNRDLTGAERPDDDSGPGTRCRRGLYGAND